MPLRSRTVTIKQDKNHT